MKVRTQPELASALGVAVSRIAKYRQKGAPIPGRGPYDVGEIDRWRKANLTRSGKPDDKPKEESLPRRKLAAEVRIKEAQADQEEAKRDKIRGSLITVAEAKREIVSLMTKVKTRLMSVPRANADRLVHLDSQAEVESILTEIIVSQLEDLSVASSSEDS